MPAVIGTAEIHNHTTSLPEGEVKLRSLELAVDFANAIVTAPANRPLSDVTGTSIVETAKKFEDFLRS